MSVTETPEATETPDEAAPDEETTETPEPIEGDEPDTDDEPEPETPAAPEESQARMEEAGKKLDLLQKHVTKRLGEILGEDATDIVPCPCCTAFGMPGWVFPIEPPDDVKAELYHYLHQAAPTDYKPDNYSRVCDECAGLGETATGSKVQGQATLTCVPCKGRGWVAVGAERGGAYIAPAGDNGDHSLRTDDESTPYEPVVALDTPEIEALKRAGYVVIPPIARG